MNKRIAFITGTTGMDASHLIEFLLEKDYLIYGFIRRSSTDNTWRIRNVLNRIELVQGDITDQSSLDSAISAIKPDEVYNLAAQSYVLHSWKSPNFTMQVNVNGLINLLEACHMFGKKDCKIYQASSSEMFGKVRETPQKETTPFYPRSIYGVSKAAAHYVAVNYRESYKMFISCGMSFNHDSFRRGLEFLSRKVSYNVAKIALNMSNSFSLGNLNSERDFGYAPEYVEAFWKMLQLNEPVDLVLSTGEKHSIREFVQEAFNLVGIYDWQEHVSFDASQLRPAEVDWLLGDSTKARELIGWNPKVRFKELVKVMVETDIERLKRGDRFE